MRSDGRELFPFVLRLRQPDNATLRRGQPETSNGMALRPAMLPILDVFERDFVGACERILRAGLAAVAR